MLREFVSNSELNLRAAPLMMMTLGGGYDCIINDNVFLFLKKYRLYLDIPTLSRFFGGVNDNECLTIWSKKCVLA